jgi:hypothetical protein
MENFSMARAVQQLYDKGALKGAESEADAIGRSEAKASGVNVDNIEKYTSGALYRNLLENPENPLLPYVNEYKQRIAFETDKFHVANLQIKNTVSFSNYINISIVIFFIYKITLQMVINQFWVIWCNIYLIYNF